MMRTMLRSRSFAFALVSVLAAATAVTVTAASQGRGLVYGEDEHLLAPHTVVEPSGRQVEPGLLRTIPERFSALVHASVGRNLVAARRLQTACWFAASLLFTAAMLRTVSVPAALITAAIFITQPFLATVSSFAFLRWGLALLAAGLSTLLLACSGTMGGEPRRSRPGPALVACAVVATAFLPFLAAAFALGAFCLHRYRTTGLVSWKSAGAAAIIAAGGMHVGSLVLRFDAGTLTTLLFGYPDGGWWFPGPHGWSDLAAWVASVPGLLADAFLFLLAAWARPLLLVSLMTETGEPWLNPVTLAWGAFVLGHAPVAVAGLALRRDRVDSSLRASWLALTVVLVALAGYAVAFPRSEGIAGAAVVLYFPFLCSGLFTVRRLALQTPRRRAVAVGAAILIVAAQAVDLSRAALLVYGH